MHSLVILAFVCGVIILQLAPGLPVPHWLWLALPATILLIRQNSLLTRLSVALLLGFLWALMFAHLRLADGLPPEWEDRPIEIIGYLDDLPVQQDMGSSFTLRTEQVLTAGARVPQRLRLFWQTQTPPQAGQRWQLTVTLQHPHALRNPDGFDAEAWLLEQNIRATGKVERKLTNRLQERVAPTPRAMLAAARAHINERIHQLLPDSRQAGTLAALVIGAQNQIEQDNWQLFRNTGVAHLMSISGLHITLLAGLIAALANWLWRRSSYLTLRLPARDAALLAGLLVAWAYTALAGFAIPAQRTLYMLSTVAGLFLLRRSVAPADVLALALLAVCLLDPWAVLAAGFWLSFGAVALLMWAGHGRIAPAPAWRRAIQAQYAVTLGLIPLGLWLFQQTSLLAPLANAFAIPLVSLAVVPLALGGALTPIDWPLQLASSLMQETVTALRWLDSFGLSSMTRAKPAMLPLVLALTGVLWLLLPRGFPARWAGLLAIFPLFLPPQPVLPVGAYQLTLLDVGQGTAAVIRTRQHALLYDSGPRYSSKSDAGQRVILPYLRSAGISRLDGMVVSHNDLDHSGGMLSLLNAIPVDWLLTSIDPALNPAHAGIRSLPCLAGQSWYWDGVHFEVLHPATNSHFNKDNDNSCVIRISSPHGRTLLTGDIEAAAEQWLLLHAAGSLRTDTLLVPHHGSNTSSTDAFLAATGARSALISAGYRNRYGHPKTAVLQRYQTHGMALGRTDQHGALTLLFDAQQRGQIKSERTSHPHYWQDMP